MWATSAVPPVRLGERDILRMQLLLEASYSSRKCDEGGVEGLEGTTTAMSLFLSVKVEDWSGTEVFHALPRSLKKAVFCLRCLGAA